MFAKEKNPVKPEGDGWQLARSYYREGITCFCGKAYWTSNRPAVCYYCGNSLKGIKAEAVLVNWWSRKKHWWSIEEFVITYGPNKEL